MDIHTATEEAYKKGYEDGMRDGVKRGTEGRVKDMRVKLEDNMVGEIQPVLKPCPFCGGKANLLFYTHYSGIKSFIVRCEDKCVVTCGHVDEKGKWHATPKKKAIETWNRRVGE